MKSILFQTGTAFTLLKLSISFSPSISHRRFSSKNSSELLSHSPNHAPVLVTFDLDDTLFPISPVIEDANNALLQTLSEMGYDAITEESMNDSSKEIRQDLRKEGIDVTYTELRKRSIEREILKLKGNLFGSVVPRDMIERLYNVWETERHLAAERYLFSDTIDMLDKVVQLIPGVSIGAITNGAGSPFAMKRTICKYFDFCVSGEDDGIFPSRKPHSGIYEAAVEKYWNLKGYDTSIDAEKLVWIHVGDDLANDVGGSSKVGAKSIFVDLNESYGQTISSSSRKDGLNVPAWSTVSKKEAEKRQILSREALKLVSGTVSNLSSLPLTVIDIIKETEKS